METQTENPWENSQESPKLDLTPRLYAVTRSLLVNRPQTLTLEAIANSTGLGISWLARMVGDKIKNPNVDSVEILYRFLSKQNPEF